ncbi:MAG TPA: hypothetical protein VGF45_09065 [Polyangia bacterium]
MSARVEFVRDLADLGRGTVEEPSPAAPRQTTTATTRPNGDSLLTNDFDNHIHFHVKREHGNAHAAAEAGHPRRSLIARGSFSSVETCGCGAVYLTVGPVCLKVAAAALPELLGVLERAALRLHSGSSQAVSACSGEAMPEDGGGEGESADDQSN